MFQTMRLKVAALVLSGSMMAIALMPAFSVQAGDKVSVYVVTDETEKMDYTYADMHQSHTVKYKYNKNGLLISKKGKRNDGLSYGDEQYKYNKKGQMTEIYDGSFPKFRNVYDKKGRLKETRVYQTVYASSKVTGTEVYAAEKLYETVSYQYNKKNQVTGRIVKDASGKMYEGDYYTRNKKGQVTKEYWNSKDYPEKVLVSKYKYDKNGNTTKQEEPNKGSISNVKNIYDSNNLLTKKTEADMDSSGSDTYRSTVTNYKYKKITVDKAFVNTIKAQQRTLINNEVNGSISNYYVGIREN